MGGVNFKTTEIFRNFWKMESGQTKADITVQRKYRESGGGVMLPGNGTTGRLQLCVALGD